MIGIIRLKLEKLTTKTNGTSECTINHNDEIVNIVINYKDEFDEEYIFNESYKHNATINDKNEFIKLLNEFINEAIEH